MDEAKAIYVKEDEAEVKKDEAEDTHNNKKRKGRSSPLEDSQNKYIATQCIAFMSPVAFEQKQSPPAIYIREVPKLGNDCGMLPPGTSFEQVKQVARTWRAPA
jgi:hypothetical protein